jgi:hypothetical protein
MITAGKKPLYENLARFTTDLGRISESISGMEQMLGTKTQLFLQGQEQNLEPLKIQLGYLQERAARLLTGFTQDKSTALDVYLQKLKRGEELGDIQRAQAFDMLKLETNYKNELAKLQTQSNLNIAEWKATTGTTPAAKGTGTGTGGKSLEEILADWKKNNQPKNIISSPPMSAQAGTVMQYPPGSGVFWTSTGQGWK